MYIGIGDECKWISQRAHVDGAVEVNMPFYLVEAFISVSVWRSMSDGFTM